MFEMGNSPEKVPQGESTPDSKADEISESVRSLETHATESTEPALSPADLPARSRKAFLRHMIGQLPECVQNRIRALKQNQLQQVRISEQFFREVYELERRFYGQSCALFDARRDILDGLVEPPFQTETSWPEDPQDSLYLDFENNEELRQLRLKLPQVSPNILGVPRFWLTVFQNVPLLSELVQDHDEPLLECLVDVRLAYDQDSYTVSFQFRPNGFLHDSSLLLTKRYFLQHSADQEYPFLFEGPEIVRCEGCHIHWRDGSNLTLQTVESRRRNRSRSVTKVMPRESFFRFFAPPQALDLSLADEKTKLILGNDFEVGFLLRTQIVPKAVLFYTGDLVDSLNEGTPDNRSLSSDTDQEQLL
ncbi:nucleosome assembly protein 1-like 1 [Drosophila subpulchrella]|uniref:nucleosome assembly protein 1-like 1 n=1 Tax=Drosophila subpulchrella TaxID=1486046 RepID=UPI0018A1A60A|nr:nucleosome assembly protein 1-like 1 [Drosophila subpulchrella]